MMPNRLRIKKNAKILVLILFWRYARYHGNIQVWTWCYVYIELEDNLTASAVLNTGETGDMYKNNNLKN